MARFTLTAVLLAGAVSAQNVISSMVFGATSSAATRIQLTPRISLASDETTLNVYAGGTATRGITGLGIDPCATTYEFICTNSILCGETDFTATITAGPSSFKGTVSTSIGGTSVYGDESCALSGTRAICVATATVVTRGTSVVVVSTAVTRASYIPLPIPKTVSIPTGSCTLPQSEQYQPVATTGKNGYTSIIRGSAIATTTTRASTTNSGTAAVTTSTSTDSAGNAVVTVITSSTRTGAAPAVTAFVGAVVPAAVAAVAALV